MNDRLRIFISAYACEPEKGSEPGIGWNVVNELARYHEVHVLTRANNREPIETFYEKNPSAAQPHFHYYDLPKWLSFWKKKRRGYHLYYYLWQYGAYFRYRGFVNQSGFDLVQHLTFANFAMPSLFMLCKPVTVWGPVGYIPIPAGVFQALPFKIRLKERLRQLLMWLLIHCEPMRVLTPRAADFILEYQDNPRSCFPAGWQYKIKRHSQTGINTSEPEYNIVSKRGRDGRIHLLICSEFIYWKGCVFAAETAAKLLVRYPETVLDIYGSGAEKNTMEKILSGNDFSDRVFWHGFVEKKEMLQALADADILLYPSYHHGLATVILQAMYFQLPIVALEGDPVAGAVICNRAGVAASGENRAEILDDLERKTEELILSQKLRVSYGKNGREAVEKHYDWRILTARLSELLIGIAKQ